MSEHSELDESILQGKPPFAATPDEYRRQEYRSWALSRNRETNEYRTRPMPGDDGYEDRLIVDEHEAREEAKIREQYAEEWGDFVEKYRLPLDSTSIGKRCAVIEEGIGPGSPLDFLSYDGGRIIGISEGESGIKRVTVRSIGDRRSWNQQEVGIDEVDESGRRFAFVRLQPYQTKRGRPTRVDELNRDLEQLQMRKIDSFHAGQVSRAYATRMRESVRADHEPSGDLLAGNVLRRLCSLGGTACAARCQAPEGFVNNEKRCADLNLKKAVEEIGVKPKDVVMVSVTGNKVGFCDELDPNTPTNSVGMPEVKGYGAFFTRATEGKAIGMRMADCGALLVEFIAADNGYVTGGIHMGRPDMQGDSALKFRIDDQPAGYFEYVLDEALKHYGGKLEDVRVSTVAAIESKDYPYTFATKDVAEERFPGWYEQGLLRNKSDRNRPPGVNPSDIWLPDYRKMVRRQILRSGIDPRDIREDDQIHLSPTINAGKVTEGHASNHADAHGRVAAGRDLYLFLPRYAITTQPRDRLGFEAFYPKR